MEHSALPIIALGFILGMKHALDVDHLAAVTTLIAGQRNRWKSVLVGIWWGLGHSVTLLVLGGVIVFFGIVFPPPVSLALEFCVGAMLIYLGGRVLVRLRMGGTLHLHAHEHGGRRHIHPHIHGGSPARTHDQAAHPPADNAGGHHALPGASARSPKSSLVVGMVHGAAGSAGLTLVLLPTMPTRAMGILYLAIFGIGSILGMSLATLVVSLPLGLAARNGRAGRIVTALAGCLGITVGAMLMVETGGELLHL